MLRVLMLIDLQVLLLKVEVLERRMEKDFYPVFLVFLDLLLHLLLPLLNQWVAVVRAVVVAGT